MRNVLKQADIYLCAPMIAFVLGAMPLATHAAATQTIYFHTDELGSPVAATDDGGYLIWKEEYWPYGARITNDPKAVGSSRWYTGYSQDSTTGLAYAGARYYDPAVGRFYGVDPKNFDEMNIPSFNRYEYANDNPFMYVDPDGRSVFTFWNEALWNKATDSKRTTPLTKWEWTRLVLADKLGDYVQDKIVDHGVEEVVGTAAPLVEAGAE